MKGLGRLGTVAVAWTALGLHAGCDSKQPQTTSLPTSVPTPVTPPAAAGAAGSGAVAPGPTTTASPTPVPTATAGSAAPPAPAAGGGSAPTPTGDVPVTPPPIGGETTTTAASPLDWRTMGYDEGSTYNNIAETKITKQNAGMLKELWTADMGGNVYGAALQIGDKIFATAPATIRAFDAATGKELWRTNASSQSSLSYMDGTLYLNTGAAKIVAVDAADGKMLWSKPHNTTETADGASSVLALKDLLIVGGSSGSIELSGGAFRGYLSGLNRMTGEIAWSTFTVPANANGASIWSSPSADSALGFAYAGTGNNYGTPATDTSDSIIQFDLKSGDIKFKAQRVMSDTFGGLGGGPDADFGANPVLYETMVGGVMTKLAGAGNKGGSAHAIRRDNGMLVWTRVIGTGAADGSSGVFTNSAWSGKNLIMACNAGGPATLYGLDGATGDIAWMRSLGAQVWGRMAIANGVGFVGVGAAVEAFDTDTGALIKSYPSKGGTVASTITISNGRVAFGEGLSWSSGRTGKTLTVLSVP